MIACKCFDQYGIHEFPPEVYFHAEIQDTGCDAWKWILDLVEEAANDQREVFDPGEIGWENWGQIVTLPATISKLKSVKKLIVMGSNLVRIPPEIGDMTSLESFEAYMSYQLHWYPFEITRCRNLVKSSASTRALYGNYRMRPPFPKLQPDLTSTKGIDLENLPPELWGMDTIRNCSVCNRPMIDSGLYQVWITLLVATDEFPLLVNACSEECVRKLPQPASGYVQEAHKGSLDLKQPPPN